mmetsp:Transcript_91086/g.174660  ORF Transcript_91086/g.174660 Transcript_91086/m.174660 type:complete len:338 (-) Transcript_91086:391-1404(-)
MSSSGSLKCGLLEALVFSNSGLRMSSSFLGSSFLGLAAACLLLLLLAAASSELLLALAGGASGATGGCCCDARVASSAGDASCKASTALLLSEARPLQLKVSAIDPQNLERPSSDGGASSSGLAVTSGGFRPPQDSLSSCALKKEPAGALGSGMSAAGIVVSDLSGCAHKLGFGMDSSWIAEVSTSVASLENCCFVISAGADAVSSCCSCSGSFSCSTVEVKKTPPSSSTRRPWPAGNSAASLLRSITLLASSLQAGTSAARWRRKPPAFAVASPAMRRSKSPRRCRKVSTCRARSCGFHSCVQSVSPSCSTRALAKPCSNPASAAGVPDLGRVALH